MDYISGHFKVDDTCLRGLMLMIALDQGYLTDNPGELNLSIYEGNVTTCSEGTRLWTKQYNGSLFYVNQYPPLLYFIDIAPDLCLPAGDYVLNITNYGSPFADPSYWIVGGDFIGDTNVSIGGDGQPCVSGWTTNMTLLEGCQTCSTNLTATNLGSNSVYLNWTNDPYAIYYMLRASTSNFPANYSDGQLIYYGTGNFTTYTGLALDISTYYIRMWETDGCGNYSVCYDEASIGGENMIYLAYGLICIAIMGLGIWRKYVWLSIMSGMAWMGFATVTLWTSPQGSTAWIFGWVGVLGMMGMLLYALSIATTNRRANRPKPKVEESEYERLEREIYSKGRRRREA
jgi:hypothetical protein